MNEHLIHPGEQSMLPAIKFNIKVVTPRSIYNPFSVESRTEWEIYRHTLKEMVTLYRLELEARLKTSMLAVHEREHRTRRLIVLNGVDTDCRDIDAEIENVERQLIDLQSRKDGDRRTRENAIRNSETRLEALGALYRSAISRLDRLDTL